MSDLNQYAISRALGSRMIPAGNVGFGNFALLRTVGTALAAPLEIPEPVVEFSYEDDRKIAKAFEDVRVGKDGRLAATDQLLWDTQLANRFHKKCAQLGLKAPGRLFTRRLINIRKNIRRYEIHGITLRHALDAASYDSIVPSIAHVIEFALVRLKYRHGASIDDILMDDILGEEFETLAHSIAPTVSSAELRRGALYIRKTRYLKKNEIDSANALDIQQLEPSWQDLGALSHVAVGKIRPTPGLVEIREKNRFLYISRNDDLRVVADQFATGDPFAALASPFWKPDRKLIEMRIIPGDKIHNVKALRWSIRLIQELKPVFNLPIAA